MSQAGSTVREEVLLMSRKNQETRFIVHSSKGAAVLWGVYDELLQIEVFHWWGANGEEKCNAVANALNALKHED